MTEQAEHRGGIVVGPRRAGDPVIVGRQDLPAVVFQKGAMPRGFHQDVVAAAGKDVVGDVLPIQKGCQKSEAVTVEVTKSLEKFTEPVTPGWRSTQILPTRMASAGQTS